MDSFKYLPVTANPLPGRRAQPVTYTAPTPNTGYPNKIANTQKVKTRGTGAATKATKHSTKMG